VFEFETITRLRAGTRTDSFGNPIGDDWDHPTQREISNCLVASGFVLSNGDPFQVGRNPLDIDLTIYVVDQAPIDVTARDRVVVRGTTYEVSGAPFLWTSPFLGGWVVNLKVRQG